MLFAKTKYIVIYYHSHCVLIANVLESLTQHNGSILSTIARKQKYMFPEQRGG